MDTRYIVSVRSSDFNRSGVVFISRDYNAAQRVFSLVKPDHEDDELVFTRMDKEVISETPMQVKNG
jgi:hypothetical protein